MRSFCIRPTIRLLLATALLATGAGCAFDGGPTAPGTPSSTSQPLPAPPNAAAVAITDTVPAGSTAAPGVYRSDVMMSRSGTATITLRWPDADYSLQLYVTTGACAEATGLLAGECTIVGRTRPGTLPGGVSSGVTSGDLNSVWVLNTDHASQNFTVSIEIE
jgi:hypothetical protein